MVWEVNRHTATENQVRIAQPELPRRDSEISENPLHIQSGNDDLFTCQMASVEIDIVSIEIKEDIRAFDIQRTG